MDNLDRIEEIMQCVGRIWSECPIEEAQVRDDLQTILENTEKIKAELLELWRRMNRLDELDLIDRDALKAKIYNDRDCSEGIYYFIAHVLLRIEAAPKIKMDALDGGADNG